MNNNENKSNSLLSKCLEYLASSNLAYLVTASYVCVCLFVCLIDWLHNSYLAQLILDTEDEEDDALTGFSIMHIMEDKVKL